MKAQLENINMQWERGLDFHIPHAGSSTNALRLFKTNRATIVWNNMSTLERNPTTLPQTETIIGGQSVAGVSLHDLMAVKNYNEGVSKLAELIENGLFKLDEATASAIHFYVGKEEALTWGQFRNSAVHIGNADYIPPDSNQLSTIAQKGFAFIDKIQSAPERAIVTFLFMSRTQFFHDANKRTASLMMNGVLVTEGFYPVIIMSKKSEEFHTKLTNFYNSGNATEIMRFFEAAVKEMFIYETDKSYDAHKETDIKRKHRP